MNRTFSQIALRTSALYGLAGGLWILFSDRLVSTLGLEPEVAARVQTYKGCAFVALTAFVLYFVLNRQFRRWERESTARRKAEADLERTGKLLQAVAHETTDAIFVKDREGRYLFFNEAAAHFVGKPVTEALGRDSSVFFDPACAAHLAERDRSVMKSGAPETYEETLTVAGVSKTVLGTKSPYRDSQGRIIGVLGISRDISDRKRSEEKLRASESRLRNIIDSMFAFVGLFSLEGHVLELNAAPLKAGGQKREDVIGRPFPDTYWWTYSPKAQEQIRRALARAAAGETVREDFPVRFADGQIAVIDTTLSPLRNSEGQITEVVASGADVTARIQAERARGETELRFRQVVENIREVFWVTDINEKRVIYVSPSYEEVWGRPCDYLYQSRAAWAESIHPEDRERITAAANEHPVSGAFDVEYRIVRPDGEVRWIRDQGFPVRDDDGRIYRIAGIAEDITSNKKLEELLRHSQKMEAIGLLAGGVAHDFNNMLTVIHGNATLLLEGDPKGPTHEYIDEILQASDRATVLTRQLLLFSRKQLMQPDYVDLSAIVRDTTKMLQRILGEDITLVTEFAPDLPMIHADAGMMEQILLNLAVNSRDAMPNGGRLCIRTHLQEEQATDVASTPNDHRSPRVCLTVSDTGAGIPPEILPRIFEPFFTTKAIGKGTGLGLATVYGIVKQHNGVIAADSAPGHGATFRIHLPAAGSAAATAKKVNAESVLPRGDETVLVVEDESAVRALACHLLEKCGYTVLAAASGPSALELFHTHRDDIQLLLTDMVMPDGISGRELARQLQAMKPNLKVIYTSGYSSETTSQEPALVEGANFLQKPYLPKKLAQAVRDCLDRKP